MSSKTFYFAVKWNLLSLGKILPLLKRIRKKTCIGAQFLQNIYAAC